jgi:hypothetical protein
MPWHLPRAAGVSRRRRPHLSSAARAARPLAPRREVAEPKAGRAEFQRVSLLCERLEVLHQHRALGLHAGAAPALSA